GDMAVGVNDGHADQPIARPAISAPHQTAAPRRDDAANGRLFFAEWIERDELATFGGDPVERRQWDSGFDRRGQISGFVFEQAIQLHGGNDQVEPRRPVAHLEPRSGAAGITRQRSSLASLIISLSSSTLCGKATTRSRSSSTRQSPPASMITRSSPNISRRRETILSGEASRSRKVWD